MSFFENFRWYPVLQKAADRAFDKSKSLEIEGELHADRLAKRKLFSPKVLPQCLHAFQKQLSLIPCKFFLFRRSAGLTTKTVLARAAALLQLFRKTKSLSEMFRKASVGNR